MLTLLLFIFLLGIGAEETYHKCCAEGEVFTRTNTSFSCTPSDQKSVQIVSEQAEFFSKNRRGVCIERIDTDIRLFEIDGGAIVGITNFSGLTYAKCCPVHYVYNTKYHSCVATNATLEAVARGVAKVGLPHCKIVLDFIDDDFEVSDGELFMRNAGKAVGEGDYCLDVDQDGNSIARTCTDDFGVCNSIRCVHKCCPDGQSFVNGPKCRFTYTHGLDLSFSNRIQYGNESFAIVHGFRRPLYTLVEKTEKKYMFELKSNGVFIIYEKKIDAMIGLDVTEDSYCIEHVWRKSSNMERYYFFSFFPKEVPQRKFIYTRYAMAVSCVFLFLTIAYYLLTKEKNHLFGKILICYCLTNLVAFTLMSYLAFERTSDGVCRIFGVFVLFTTVSTFTWMNIMCIDIYLTFGTLTSFVGSQQNRHELKRFLAYGLYGWGFPFVLITFLLVSQQMDVLPEFLRFTYGKNKCYIDIDIRGNYSKLVFVTTPLTILEICNFILFAKTIVHCWKVKNEIGKMNDTQIVKGRKTQTLLKYKERLFLVLKLFFVMGISFLFEIVSLFVDFKANSVSETIEIAWDTFNCLQGLFVFVIFVCKRRIARSIQEKIGWPKMRKISEASTTHTVVNAALPD